ncbi:MAG: hypothetical protein ACYC9Q_11530 [Bacillota bacterium]
MRRGLQKFATAALTPIAVLPAAALLYALGAVVPVPVIANALTASPRRSCTWSTCSSPACPSRLATS